ncbi:MAG: hypothetical protein ACJAVB_002131, partial [Cyclobacteriaceae bacterium]
YYRQGCDCLISGLLFSRIDIPIWERSVKSTGIIDLV